MKFRAPIKERRFAVAGLGAPESGGKHPHRGDIDWTLMKRVLADAEVTEEEWDGIVYR